MAKMGRFFCLISQGPPLSAPLNRTHTANDHTNAYQRSDTAKQDPTDSIVNCTLYIILYSFNFVVFQPFNTCENVIL
jgi:hypothetical protein